MIDESRWHLAVRASAVSRRGLVLSAGAATLGALQGCSYPPTFNVSWEEELALLDGSTSIVELRYVFHRLYRQNLYEHAYARDCELTFDAGSSAGRVTQFFMGAVPMLLDRVDGRWYLYLNSRSYAAARATPGQDWADQTGCGITSARLEGSRFVQVPINSTPAHLNRANFMQLLGPTRELAGLQGARVTLPFKRKYVSEHPLDPCSLRMERPVVRKP